jgi:hypothetical protein
VISEMGRLVVTLFFQTASCGNGSWLSPGRQRVAFGFECQTASGKTAEGVSQQSRGTKCPSSASSSPPLENRGHRECQALNAPAALRAMKESTQASHHRYAETIRHSLREWFYGLYVLSPGVPGFRGSPAKLDLSVGRPGPNDFAVHRHAARLAARPASIASCTHRS